MFLDTDPAPCLHLVPLLPTNRRDLRSTIRSALGGWMGGGVTETIPEPCVFLASSFDQTRLGAALPGPRRLPASLGPTPTPHPHALHRTAQCPPLRWRAPTSPGPRSASLAPALIALDLGSTPAHAPSPCHERVSGAPPHNLNNIFGIAQFKHHHPRYPKTPLLANRVQKYGCLGRHPRT